jgi:hypothetical protein
VGVSHPNLWVFIRKMKDEQTIVHATLAHARNGDNPPRGRLVYQQNKKRVKRLKKDNIDGQRSLTAYWKAVSHTLHAFQ